MTYLSKRRDQNVHNECREEGTQDGSHCSRPVEHEEETAEAHCAQKPVEPPRTVVNAASDGVSVDIRQQ